MTTSDAYLTFSRGGARPAISRPSPATRQISCRRDGIDPMKRQGGLAASFKQVAAGSAKILLQEDGPRIAVLSYDDWAKGS